MLGRPEKAWNGTLSTNSFIFLLEFLLIWILLNESWFCWNRIMRYCMLLQNWLLSSISRYYEFNELFGGFNCNIIGCFL
jgi:hypothetical protein